MCTDMQAVTPGKGPTVMCSGGSGMYVVPLGGETMSSRLQWAGRLQVTTM